MIYCFKLANWVIAYPSDVSFSWTKNYCDSLGSNYRIPTVAEYTNAKKYSENNHYQRRIGEGLFTEWGAITAGHGNGASTIVTYPESDFGWTDYWAIDNICPSGQSTSIGAGGGNISCGMTNNVRAACITP